MSPEETKTSEAEDRALILSLRELASQILLKTSSDNRGEAERLSKSLLATAEQYTAYLEKHDGRWADLAKIGDLSLNKREAPPKPKDEEMEKQWLLERVLDGVIEDALWVAGHRIGGARLTEEKARKALVDSVRLYEKVRRGEVGN